MRTHSHLQMFMIVPVCVILFLAGAHAQEKKQRDIVETASSSKNLNTFIKAVKAADLAESLKNHGPFTVFAPTDEAFGKLPAGMLKSWFNDSIALKRLLKYHVVPGRLTATDIDRLDSVQTWLGRRITIDTSQDTRLEEAKILKSDVTCLNGVIHVIDCVLVPRDDLIETARKTGSFTILLKAVEAANLTKTLRGKEPFTLLAPTDEAFGKLPPHTLDRLLGDPGKLKTVLNLHLLRGRIFTKEIKRKESLRTVQGKSLRIEQSDGIKVGGARVMRADVKTSNGVLHAVDAVILPD